MRMTTAAAMACMLVCVAPAATAQDELPGAEHNVLVTFVVGKLEGGREVPLKTYEMLVDGNGDRSEMMTGARVPIPVTSFNVQGDGGAAAPVTSFTYQNVGFTATIEATVGPDDRIRLLGSIEDSSMADTPAADGRPIIQTLNQRIRATLHDGKPVRLNRVEESGTRSLYVQVQADLLDERGRGRKRR